jgi:hypothetical protein
MRCLKAVTFTAVSFASLATHAQFFMDTEGARAVLAGSDTLAGAQDRIRVNLDFTQATLGLNYFTLLGSESHGTNGEAIAFSRDQQHSQNSDFWVLGFSAKVGETSGLSVKDLVNFNLVPTIQGSIGLDWNPKPTESGFEPFMNVRATYQYQQYKILDGSRPPGSQLYTAGFSEPSFTLTVGTLLPRQTSKWDIGLAMSVGYDYQSNFKDLPSIDITGATNAVKLPGVQGLIATKANQTVGLGHLRGLDAMPMSQSIAFTLPEEPINAAFHWVFDQTYLNREDPALYTLIAGAYGRELIRDLGKPEHALGVTISLRRRTSVAKRDTKGRAPTPEQVGAEKWAFPIHFFAERVNVFGGPKPKFNFGTTVSVSFP